ncbi:MAG: hypothetical protein NTW61_03085 [Candidatus Melainabacteria bacterium]|nr:hypothetical protein [Candidatus Melainabacteria bacterium]
MSISPMSSNVYNNMGYGAKAESPKKPAGAEPASVQPREEAPVASDTVELSAKKPADDTSATPALDTTATTTTPPQAGLPLLPIIGGGVVGAGLGGIPTYMWWSGSDEDQGGKPTVEDGKFKPKSDEYKVTDQKSVEHKGFTYNVKTESDKATIDTITGSIKGDDTNIYTYSKTGTETVATKELKADDSFIKTLFHTDPADTAKSFQAVDYHVEIKGDKAVLKPLDSAKNTLHPHFEFNIDKDGLLTSAIKAEPTKNPLLTDAFITEAKTALERIKLGNAYKEFKAFSPQKLADMIHLEGGGSRNWIAVGLAALGLGAVGAAAGFFYGKPKQVTAPDASTVS